MSGAEILFGVGIACNAMQILSFGSEVVKLSKQLKDSASIDPRVEQYKNNADSIISDIEAKTADKEAKGISLRPEELKVVKCAQDGAAAIRTIVSMTNDWTVPANSKGMKRFASSIRKATGAVWHQKKFERAQRELQDQQQLLQTRLLLDICSQADAAEIQRLSDFQAIHTALQEVILKHAAADVKLSQLVTAQAQANRDHVTESDERIRGEIKTSNREFQHIQQEENRVTRFLDSLVYPERNSRRSGIPRRNPQTFRWVFDGDDSTGDESENLCHNDGSDAEDEAASNTVDSVAERSRENLASGIDMASRGGASVIDIAFEFDGFTESEDECESLGDSSSSSQLNESYVHMSQKTFRDWLVSDENLLWVQGKPGSGKSSLMKFIVTQFEDNKRCLPPSYQESMVLSHFFWKPGGQLGRSIKGMLCSVLHQFIGQDRSQATQLLQHQPLLSEKKFVHDWETYELADILCKLLTASTLPVFTFLDGLDEIIEEEQGEILKVLDMLLPISGVRLCVSSRPENRFSRYFGVMRQIIMQDVNYKDIKSLVRSQLSTESSISQTERATLLRAVTSRADGVFLWAVFVTDSLNRGIRDSNTFDELIERVYRMPSKLTDIYKDMWARLGDDAAEYMQAAAQFFQIAMWTLLDDVAEGRNIWIFTIATQDELQGYFSRLRCGSLELTEAESIKIKETCGRVSEQIRTRCAGFLHIVASENRMRVPSHPLDTQVEFVHRTALDFISDTDEGKAILDSSPWNEQEKWLRLVKAAVLADHIPEKRVHWLNVWNSRKSPMGYVNMVTHPIHTLLISERRATVFSGDAEKQAAHVAFHLLDELRDLPQHYTKLSPAITGDFGALYYQSLWNRVKAVHSFFACASWDLFLLAGPEALLGAGVPPWAGGIKTKSQLIRHIVGKWTKETHDTRLSNDWTYAIDYVFWSLICTGVRRWIDWSFCRVPHESNSNSPSNSDTDMPNEDCKDDMRDISLTQGMLLRLSPSLEQFLHSGRKFVFMLVFARGQDHNTSSSVQFQEANHNTYNHLNHSVYAVLLSATYKWAEDLIDWQRWQSDTERLEDPPSNDGDETPQALLISSRKRSGDDEWSKLTEPDASLITRGLRPFLCSEIMAQQPPLQPIKDLLRAAFDNSREFVGDRHQMCAYLEEQGYPIHMSQEPYSMWVNTNYTRSVLGLPPEDGTVLSE